MSDSNLKVLLVGHYGKQNLGDDAMLEGIRQAFPAEHELCVAAARPIEGVRTCRLRLLSLFREALGSDWVWMGGGSWIDDEGTNPRYKHRGLLQALAIFLIAKVARCKLAYIGMGLGPIRHDWKRRFVGALFSRADYVSLRDSASIGEWSRCSPSRPDVVRRTFDSCVIIQPQDTSGSKHPCSSETREWSSPKVIGVNLLPYFQIYEDDPAGDERLMDLIVGALRESLDTDTQIRLFTFCTKNTESEQALIEEGNRRLSRFTDTEVIPYSSPSTTIREIGQCDAMAAMRYHGSMMAYLAGVPQIVLSYHEKCSALARDIGCSPRSVIDIRHLHTKGPLVDAFTGIQREPSSFCASLPVSDALSQFKSSYFPEEIFA